MMLGSAHKSMMDDVYHYVVPVQMVEAHNCRYNRCVDVHGDVGVNGTETDWDC